jgi:hypothetical protein
MSTRRFAAGSTPESCTPATDHHGRAIVPMDPVLRPDDDAPEPRPKTADDHFRLHSVEAEGTSCYLGTHR